MSATPSLVRVELDGMNRLGLGRFPESPRRSPGPSPRGVGSLVHLAADVKRSLPQFRADGDGVPLSHEPTRDALVDVVLLPGGW
jgi:hypothetical protein